MSFNILDAVRSCLTPAIISKISLFLGEEDAAVDKALSGLMPVILSGFVAKANEDSRKAKDILDIVRNVYRNGINHEMDDVNSNLFNKRLHFTQTLFADKYNSIIDAIAFYAVIKKESAISLSGIIASLMAGMLGKYVTDVNMNAAGLSSYLCSQKTNVMNMLPAGLSGIAPLLGLSKMGDNSTPRPQRHAQAKTIEISPLPPELILLLWILLFLAAAAAVLIRFL